MQFLASQRGSERPLQLLQPHRVGIVPKKIGAGAPGASVATTQSDASREGMDGLLAQLTQQAKTATAPPVAAAAPPAQASTPPSKPWQARLLGTPAGASLAADIAAIEAETAVLRAALTLGTAVALTGGAHSATSLVASGLGASDIYEKRGFVLVGQNANAGMTMAGTCTAFNTGTKEATVETLVGFTPADGDLLTFTAFNTKAPVVGI